MAIITSIRSLKNKNKDYFGSLYLLMSFHLKSIHPYYQYIKPALPDFSFRKKNIQKHIGDH